MSRTKCFVLPDNLLSMSGGQGKACPIRHGEEISGPLPNLCHGEDDAAATGEEMILRQLPTDFTEIDSKSLAPRNLRCLNFAIMTVGYGIYELSEWNLEGPGMSGWNGSRSCRYMQNPGSCLTVPEFQMNFGGLFSQIRPQSSNQPVGLSRGQIGEINSDCMHKMTFHAIHMPVVPFLFSL